MKSKNKRYIWFLITGIFILIVPTLVYLIILVPMLSSEYNTLMASGGIISGVGLFGAQKIPETIKYGKMFKLTANAFTIMVVLAIVEKFLIQILGIVAVFIVSFIVFKIFMEVYKNGKRKRENTELAEEIARNIT